jgi:hypothetical protein
MRSARPLCTVLSVLISIFATNISVRAADDEADEYDVKARVIRISLIKGEVSLKREGSSDWERARLNFPVVEGDTLATDRESRLEMQIDSRNFVRVEANSVLRIVTLRDEGIALSLVEGTASVRLAKFDREHEYFEVDAPKTTLAAERPGLYRVDVTREGKVRLTVRDGARARIYSETSGFALRDGRAAELLSEGSDAGDWELMAAGESDSWDNWVTDRERYLAQRLRYDTQYYDNYVWGAEDLAAYGDWSYANDYGWIWRPHLSVINDYNDWAPYRYGHWTWCPPYGWTWVGFEPWGWAPYHYGRWVYYDNYWAWCPRSQYYSHRSWWRPALVAFVSVHLSFGNNICWYPLSYHARDPHSRYYRTTGRLSPLRSAEIANLRRVNPAYLRAVTGLPAKDFGTATARLERTNDVIARRVVNAEPLRGDLPVRPAYAIDKGAATGDRTERVIVARPARVTPTVELRDRPTGAAARSPGVPLDDELRRARVLNGRDPRPAVSPESRSSGATEARSTGAVARPTRPKRDPADRVDNGNPGVNTNMTPDQRHAQPSQSIPQGGVRGLPEGNDQRERRPAAGPTKPTSSEEGSPPPERPARPGRNDRPGKTERRERNDQPVRPDNAEEPARVERPERRERNEAAPLRTEAPARRSEPPTPRSEPAPRNEPPPRRSETPQRYERPQRAEPPPQRSEPPPQRSEPPPQRSEPPPQRSQPAPQRTEPAKPPADRPTRAERKGEA